MSVAAPVRAPRARPPQPAIRPRLRIIPGGPLTVGRLPFALLVGGILGGGLVVLLLLHTLAAQDAFRLQTLQATQAQLADTEQQLALAAQHDQSPAVLARRAHRLGMVSTGSISFVKVRHGRVVGVVKAAPPPPPPAPDPTPSTTTDSKPGAGTAPHTRAGTTPRTRAGTATKPATKPTTHRRATRHPRG